MKQSSTFGSLGPSVKVLLGVMEQYGAGPPVGIPPASSGRCEFVHSETSVPSIVGEPVRLKYLRILSASDFGFCLIPSERLKYLLPQDISPLLLTRTFESKRGVKPASIGSEKGAYEWLVTFTTVSSTSSPTSST